jgi:type VI secretion system protein ImpF
MAELSLRERLQPMLLDRLVDDERLLVLFEIAVDRAELARLGLSAKDLSEILVAQGLQAVPAPPDTADRLVLSFSAPYGRVSLSHLKSLVLKPPKQPNGVALQTFCKIEARTLTNDALETSERRFTSMRRLRECVCRDLASLLNSTALSASIDLEAYPEVQGSVLNYGMPALSGRTAATIDIQRTARIIEEVIRRFEPRLRRVHVVPDTGRENADGHQIGFRIEAELWGQPVPQHLVLRTRISTESGDVSVADSGSK